MGYNVLPWRTRQNSRGRKQLLLGFVVAILLAMLLNSFPYHSAAHVVAALRYTNQQLQQHAKQQQQILAALQHHQQESHAINGQIDWVERLQHQRELDITLFNLLPRLVPDGLYLTTWQRSGDQLHFAGNAQSADQVSNMMQRMGSFRLLQGPVLEQINRSHKADGSSHFTLQATLISAVGWINDETV